jgi:predicted HTH transcriptional regulator
VVVRGDVAPSKADEMHITVDLKDTELLARMKNFEDHLVERKTVKDEKDWKKTAVAFANSAPVGLPAVLYVGVRNNGEIETPQHNLDEVQKRFNTQMEKVYPRVAYVPKVVSDSSGRQALAVIIPGSELRPHFAGLSYVRKGSESIEASEEQFAELIASRIAKSREILKWKSKVITVHFLNVEQVMHSMGRVRSTSAMVVQDCNSFYVTLNQGNPISYTLRDVDISFDHQQSRLALEISQN